MPTKTEQLIVCKEFAKRQLKFRFRRALTKSRPLIADADERNCPDNIFQNYHRT